MPCRARIPSPTCSAFSAGLTCKPVVCPQPFGKACNRVGMPRPKKRKVEAVEATAVAAEVDLDTGNVGDDHPSPGSGQTPTLPASPQATELSPYSSAVDEMVKLQLEAEIMRTIANKKKDNERCAQRTFDYKMMRLDNGKKRSRRKGGKGDINAVFRRYEGIIAYLEAKHKSEWYQRKAAEAETAAAEAAVAVLRRRLHDLGHAL